MTTDAILQTKLHVPLLRSNLVLRSRLIDKLNAGLDGRLILISAPAGSGKTTLVTEWLAWNESSRSKTVDQVAWLSLDEGDNDPQRFMMYLLAALRQINAGIGRSTEMMMQSPQPPPNDGAMTALVNDISAVSKDFLLILDDYQVLHSSPVLQQVNFLVEHQPWQMRLVIITREDPPLPLPRLRARGQLIEIRQGDLRFTVDECADFLNRVMGLNLSPADIAAMERRTEGWIAGLQLAALSMRGRDDLSNFIETFTGSSHFVLDYLIEEVFRQQPDDVQDFLLKTAILERLCGPLCDALTGRTDSRSLLEKIEHANLFIIPLDQARTWYRYHHLFADLLKQRLQTSGIASEAELHQVASSWFQKEGYLPEAIHHSLIARDWERAAELIGEQSVRMLRLGELMTLLGWLRLLPDNVVRGHLNLCRDYGWALTLTGQFDAAVPHLEYAELKAQGHDEQLGQVLVAQAYLARARGDNRRAILLAKQALELVAETDVLHQGLVLFTLGFAFLGTGQFVEAEPVLIKACESTRASGNDYARLTALGLLGSIHKNHGRLRRAAELCRQAVQEAHGSPAVAQTQVFLASILYEWNDLDGASEQLDQALEATRQIGNLVIQPEIFRTMVHIKLARGDTGSAVTLLDELDQSIHGIESPVAQALVAAIHADLALIQGDLPTVSYWAQKMMEDVDPAALGLQIGMTQARFLLAQGNRAEAGKLLAGMYESVLKSGMTASRIEVRAMQAVMTDVSTDALQFLRDALKMAQPEGFVRTFVDKGEPMKFMLERLRAEGGELKEYVLALLSVFGEKAIRDSKDQPLVESMSERELEILRLMALGLSNREIAERLVITVGTTKSHVHHILEKLGTESRMQAVAKARETGLL